MRNPSAEAALLRGELPVWVLQLTFPNGERALFSTASIDIQSDSPLDTAHLQALPLLAGIQDFIEELDLFSLSGVGALTQVKVSIAWHASTAAMQADWMHLSAAKAELSIMWPGQKWGERIILLASGTVQGMTLGIAGESTELVLETTPPRVSATVGDDSVDLGDYFGGLLIDLVGDPISDLAGRKFQVVYGKPRSVPGYKIGVFGGNNRLVLAGHAFPDLGNVDIFLDGAYIFNLTPIVHVNGYTYVESPILFAAADGAYTYSADHGGIAAHDALDRPAIGGADVLARLLTESGLDVDWASMEPALQMLREWAIGFYIDTEATAISVIRDKFLGTAPIVEMHSGKGIYFAYSDPWAKPVEGHLIVGQDLLGRTGKLGVSDLEAIENSFSIQHSYECAGSTYSGTETRGADDSALCYLSQQLYGLRAADPVAKNMIWDAQTAQRYLHHRINRGALPRRQVSYLAAPDLYWIRAGMVVSITDADLGITEHRAVVRTISRAQNPAVIAVDFLDRTPVSDT